MLYKRTWSPPARDRPAFFAATTVVLHIFLQVFTSHKNCAGARCVVIHSSSIRRDRSFSRFPIAPPCARSRFCFCFCFWKPPKTNDPRRRHDTTKKYTVDNNNDARQKKYQPTKTTTPKSIPRGFRKTWSIEQLANIAGLGQTQRQQHEGRQRQHENADGTTDTPPEGAVEDPNTQTGDEYPASPVFLSEEAVATLGTPCGGDIDPVMTAVFKVTPPIPIVVPAFFLLVLSH